MKHRPHAARLLPLSTFLLLVASVDAQQESTDRLARGVQSIFSRHCWSCHGEKPKAGLDLRSVRAIRLRKVLQGGDKSKLLRMLSGDRPKMPKGRKPLSKNDIDLIRDWLKAGGPELPQQVSRPDEITIRSKWWAFQPLKNAKVPPGKAHPIDAFIRAKHSKVGLKANKPADRRTLIRRVYFDLHGLPPSQAEVESFVRSGSSDPLGELVDRLLKSPHYGERWGRHWLDVVRYADTGGFETDIYFPNAWRYRDYVIKSLNDDKPFNRFVLEQIAGDELFADDLELRGTFEIPADKRRNLEARIGTGVFTFGPVYHEAALNGHQLRYERLTDSVDMLGEAFLGLTITCARCHDHKFDPITQRDYHRLMDVFAGSAIRNVPVVHKMSEFGFYSSYPRLRRVENLRDRVKAIDERAKQRVVAKVVGEFDAKTQAAFRKPAKTRTEAESILASQVEEALSRNGLRENADGTKLRIPLTKAEQSERDKLIHKLGEATLKAPLELASATILGPADTVYPVQMTTRGDYRLRGETVTAGVPAVFTSGKEVTLPNWNAERSLGRRSELARWLTSPKNPLVARVIVNRLWHGHFGQGLVTTPNNLGLQSEEPELPELLDYLARKLMNDGWSLKKMHRFIMTSEAYQRSTTFQSANAAKDKENRLFWRMNRRRLDAESIRDYVLSTAGTLNLKMSGKPVVVPLTAEEKLGMWALDQWPETLDKTEHTRRSVYLYVKRSFPLPMLTTFDSPDTSVSCGRRVTTTVAPQALTLLNSRFMIDQAVAFANRIRREHKSVKAQAVAAWKLALGREPTQAELNRAVSLVGGVPSKAEQNQQDVGRESNRIDGLARLALVLFNLNEFVYVD